MPRTARSTRPTSGRTPADEGIEGARADDRARAEAARSFDEWQAFGRSMTEDTPEMRFLGALALLKDADVAHLLTLSPVAIHTALRCTMAARGLNETGRWVGFPAAALVHRSASEERGSK